MHNHIISIVNIPQQLLTRYKWLWKSSTLCRINARTEFHTMVFKEVVSSSHLLISVGLPWDIVRLNCTWVQFQCFTTNKKIYTFWTTTIVEWWQSLLFPLCPWNQSGKMRIMGKTTENWTWDCVKMKGCPNVQNLLHKGNSLSIHWFFPYESFFFCPWKW